MGRTLGPQDDGRDAEPAMVLTYAYWARVFGADPAVVGRTAQLINVGEPKTTRIVGVLAPGVEYTGTRRQDFFANYATNEHYLGASMGNQRDHRMTDVFARLAPGATVDEARSELAALHAAWVQQFPEAYPRSIGLTVSAGLWQDELTRNARPNLTLARLIRRERELGVRAALGASRAALRRQLLTENLLLAGAGAVVGLMIASFSLDLLVQYANRFTVRTGEIGLHVPVLLFTVAVAVCIAVLLAWAPSLPGGSALGSAASVSGGGRGVVGLARKHAQGLLVVGQLALSFTLLIGAGLLVQSLVNLTRLDAGIDYEDVVSMQAPNSTGRGNQENRALMDEVVERVGALPGVRAAAYAYQTPWDVQSDPQQPALLNRTFRVEGGDERGTTSPMSYFNFVSPLYFQTVGVAVVRGRTFLPGDDASAEPVAIVNERMAKDLFGAADPIGQRIAEQDLDAFTGAPIPSWGRWLRVIGVATDTREYGLAVEGAHTLYRPAAQTGAGASLLIRTSGDPTPLFERVRAIVAELDPNRPVDRLASLASLRAEDLAPTRLNATLFSAFALLALLIAAIGVLGCSASR